MPKAERVLQCLRDPLWRPQRFADLNSVLFRASSVFLKTLIQQQLHSQNSF